MIEACMYTARSTKGTFMPQTADMVGCFSRNYALLAAARQPGQGGDLGAGYARGRAQQR